MFEGVIDLSFRREITKKKRLLRELDIERDKLIEDIERLEWSVRSGNMKVIFKTVGRIRRVYKGREMVIFYPSSQQEGELLSDGSVLAKSSKCDGLFKLDKNEIEIVMYL